MYFWGNICNIHCIKMRDMVWSCAKTSCPKSCGNNKHTCNTNLHMRRWPWQLIYKIQYRGLFVFHLFFIWFDHDQNNKNIRPCCDLNQQAQYWLCKTRGAFALRLTDFKYCPILVYWNHINRSRPNQIAGPGPKSEPAGKWESRGPENQVSRWRRPNSDIYSQN